MNARRWIIGVSSLLTGLLLAVFAGAPAQAATAAHHTSGGKVVMLPAVPSGAAQFVVTPNVAAPTISPSVSTEHVTGSSYTCPSGDLCTVVWDPTTGSWKIFFLYICAKYSLSNWLNGGNFTDNQTTGTVSHFYGSTGNTLETFTAKVYNVTQDWTPVYSIRNC